MSIRQRIVGCVALVFICLAFAGAFAFSQMGDVDDEGTKLQTDSLPGLDQSQQLMFAYQRSMRLALQHVDGNDRPALDEFAYELVTNSAKIQRLEEQYRAALSGARDHETFQAFERVSVPYDRTLAATIRLSSNPKTKSQARAALHERLQPEFANVLSALFDMVAFNQENANRSAARVHTTLAAARNTIFMTFIVALFIASTMGYLLLRSITSTLRGVAELADRIARGELDLEPTGDTRRDEIGLMLQAFDRMVVSLKNAAAAAESIASGNLTVTIEPQSDRDVMGHALANMIAKLSTLVRNVQRSGISVNSSLIEIAATAKQQQATATVTAATATEIGATSNEISATSRELVKTMTEVSAVAEETSTLASNGQASLLHMSETMHNVMEAGGSINAKLTILNEKAANINQVVTTITKVADQTNLLSLNAAIEAEKAGEYGRGFSVVASEIRRLADQTAVATYDIEQMVKEILSAISAGAMGMEKFSEAVRAGLEEVQLIGSQLTQIVGHVQALAPRVEAVNEGMQAQATGADQITQALKHLIEAAQQTVESLRLSSQAVDDLSRMSGGLRDGVSTFKLAA